MKRSGAMQLLDIVWKKTGGATGHSWDRINHAMGKALELAIMAGMRFNRGDFAEFAKRYDSHYWIGNSGGDMTGERFYCFALTTGNPSAVLSFEQWKNRPPFIANVKDGYSAYGHHHSKRTGRLSLGDEFSWKGMEVKLTSFAVDGQSITACAYKPKEINDEGYELSVKVARRFKISIGDLRAEMTARRKAAKQEKADD